MCLLSYITRSLTELKHRDTEMDNNVFVKKYHKEFDLSEDKMNPF